MDKLEFSGKAETLQKLQGTLRHAIVLPQLHFSLRTWFAAHRRWANTGLHEEWLSQPLIVRSSARNEDHKQHSMAGQYLSVANVQGIASIEKAIELVIDSFEEEDPDHQILIQPMVRNIQLSGVAFSYEPGQCSPYYVVNYDDNSSASNSVTQGLGKHLKLIYIAKSAEPDLSGWKNKLLGLIKELERLFGNNAIDLEFTVTTDDKLILLQVRPLPLPTQRLMPIHRQKTILTRLKQRFREACQPDDRCLGQTNLWGVMPDWNPAEIIGLRPKPLAYSLYQQLVTDNIWAQQRYAYGYRDVRGVPLMLNVYGIPYIDVRASFNSFIPRQLPDHLACRLVDIYLQRLKSHPDLHDKVEFDVVLASDHFCLPEALQELSRHGFSRTECDMLRSSLMDLTHNIIDPHRGLWLSDRQKVQQLPALHQQIMKSQAGDRRKLISLLSLCREYGTGPFAGLARTAFVAMQFLQSLVKSGVLSTADQALFMRSLSTVNGDLLHAARNSSREDFLQKYGHMRPGMYDLLSPRYDEMPDEYFCWNFEDQERGKSLFTPNNKQKTQLGALLKQHNYEYTPHDFLVFIKQAIEWREKAKFLFGHTVSEILLLCRKLGQDYQLGNQDLAFLNIEQVIQLSNTRAALDLVKNARKHFNITRSLILPPLITRTNDIDCFQIQSQQPNFITLKRVTAPVVHLSAGSETFEGNLTGKIIMIPNADPGYNWLFTHNIAGLMTLYGGCNSHMAIRAAELGLPAVIGMGEILFQQCKQAQLLTLDCEQQKVYRIQ